MSRKWPALPVLFAVVAAVAWAKPASAQWQLDSKDGKAGLKIGFLAQPQLEVVETPDGSSWAQNIFLRRFRLLLGGKVTDTWSFFFETDSPNVGKTNPDAAANPAGTKDSGYLYLQDAFVTYEHSAAFKIDSGMVLPPLGHNHNQSAATLLPVDYGPYSFGEASACATRVGRDYGVQLRGYPLGQHLEYRFGVFQGVRGVEARNEFRVAGRAVWYPFAAETGFFYAGTFQGARRVLGVGASFDHQKSYHQYGADAFVEQPFNQGLHGITAQVNWMRFDGGTFLKALPKQDTYLVEAAVHVAGGRLSPFVQFAGRDYEATGAADQHYWQAGAAYWMAGHQRNIKVSAGRQHTDGMADRTQVLVQLQIFYY